jgi:anti-anti-sigma factor
MQFPQRLSCRVEVRGDGVHLIVSGELDHQTADDFDLAVRGVLTGFPDALVLDLSMVDFISAVGTVALVDAVHRAAATCASVVILPSGPVRRRLAALGLDQALVLGADPATGHTPPAASA